MAKFVELLNTPALPQSGDTLSSTTSGLQFFATTTLMKGGRLRVGDAFLVDLAGVVVTPLITVNTITMTHQLGGITLASTPALQISTALTSATGFFTSNLKITVISLTPGTSSVLECQGGGMIPQGVSSVLTPFALGNSTTVTGPDLATVGTDNTYRIGITFGTLNVGTANTIQLRQTIVRATN